MFIAGLLLGLLALTSYRFFQGSRDWGFFIGAAAVAGAVSYRAFTAKRLHLNERHTLIGPPRLMVGGAGLATTSACLIYGVVTIYWVVFK